LFKKIKYTRHALEEAKIELGEGNEGRVYGDEDARRFIENNLRQATFISEIMNEAGKIDRLYAYRRYAFVLDRHDDVVITCYRRDNVHEDIRAKVRDLLFKELEEMAAQEDELLTEVLAADFALTLQNELKRRQYVYPDWETSQVLKLRYTTAKGRLHAFRLEKSKIAKGIAAYM
jgi:hypothetical protein